jgi:hypothetical protein
MVLGYALLHPTYGDSIALASLEVSDITIQNFPVNPNSVTAKTVKLDVSDDGVPEIRTGDRTLENLGICEVSAFQISSNDRSFLHNYSSQIGTFEVDIDQRSERQVGSFQVGSFQVGSFQVSLPDIRVTEVNVPEINALQFSPTKIYSTEISLPSSVTLQQFLTSHNFSLQNTTIPTLTEFLTGTTPFNLNIEITDLPTGQLAEANITGFDSNGRPTTGTLTLDLDANGLGWF